MLKSLVIPNPPNLVNLMLISLGNSCCMQQGTVQWELFKPSLRLAIRNELLRSNQGF